MIPICIDVFGLNFWCILFKFFSFCLLSIFIRLHRYMNMISLLNKGVLLESYYGSVHFAFLSGFLLILTSLVHCALAWLILMVWGDSHAMETYAGTFQLMNTYLHVTHINYTVFCWCLLRIVIINYVTCFFFNISLKCLYVINFFQSLYCVKTYGY